MTRRNGNKPIIDLRPLIKGISTFLKALGCFIFIMTLTVFLLFNLEVTVAYKPATPKLEPKRVFNTNWIEKGKYVVDGAKVAWNLIK